jgi:hypothetical protein
MGNLPRVEVCGKHPILLGTGISKGMFLTAKPLPFLLLSGYAYTHPGFVLPGGELRLIGMVLWQ